ncbi:MAG: hypothetical protein KatS3mg105_2068 [Gemmatales bacterium]|nr:MAG: hypothetical protein KatS3mg105_2068 [Gemmatales bacterium]
MADEEIPYVVDQVILECPGFRIEEEAVADQQANAVVDRAIRSSDDQRRQTSVGDRLVERLHESRQEGSFVLDETVQPNQ